MTGAITTCVPGVQPPHVACQTCIFLPAQLDDDWNTYHLFVEAMRRRASAYALYVLAKAGRGDLARLRAIVTDQSVRGLVVGLLVFTAAETAAVGWLKSRQTQTAQRLAAVPPPPPSRY